MRYGEEPNRVQDLCSSQYSLTHIMWWVIKKPHQFKETVFFPCSSQKNGISTSLNTWYWLEAWTFHLLPWAPKPQLPALLGSLLVPCSAVGCSNKLHPGHQGYKWGSPKPLGMQINSCLQFQVRNGAWPPFTSNIDRGQKPPRLTILALICYCTFSYGGSMLLIQHIYSGRKRLKTEMPSYALYSLQGRHLEIRNLSLSYKISNPDMPLKDTLAKIILVFHQFILVSQIHYYCTIVY